MVYKDERNVLISDFLDFYFLKTGKKTVQRLKVSLSQTLNFISPVIVI